MAKIDAAYNYLLTTYGKPKGSRYDTHKKSELRSVYNDIIKTNKESPLYKIAQTGDLTEFTLDIKENANNISRVVNSISGDNEDFSSILKKKHAVSSDNDIVSVNFVGKYSNETKDGFDMEVIKLAEPQINTGNFLSTTGHDFEEGSFSFDLDIAHTAYEFQMSVNEGDTNLDVQNKIARLINQSDIGLDASIIENNKGESALQIVSKKTGLAENESTLFNINSGSSWNEIRLLGIATVSSPASNSIFKLNGKEHSSLSNTFTIDKSFEVTMNSVSSEGEPVHIGFKANSDTIADAANSLAQAYNGMVAVGHKYFEAHNNKTLLNETTAVTRGIKDDLALIGITSNEEGYMEIDREKLIESISGNDSSKSYKTLNTLKNALKRQSSKASINPMKYVDKVIVEYKNPGKTLTAPYAPSAYSGLLVDRSL
ncbi:MAG: flagellar capping protein [Lachnospiraceae bacterium]|nr:flagellar capping protein [Lachnospiraceae bacterium]